MYASTDGNGTLLIGDARFLDADDCLAQMIFHELCHSLIEGPDAFSRPDWGLDNTTPRDHEREHACLRVQAALADEYGLRRLLAPTTDFRAYYDQLGADPLWPRFGPSVGRSVTWAIQGIRRADRPPWAPHLSRALAATARIAHTTARFTAPEPAGAPPLWDEIEPIPERHPVGFTTGRTGDPDRTCATCAWRYRGGPGRIVDRCRQADGARVAEMWPACNRWEPALDCQDCGACCRAAYDSVTVSRRDPAIKRHPELVVDRGSYIELARVSDDQGGNRCAALSGGRVGADGAWQPYACRIYDERPRLCREFELGGAHCLTARRRVGLSR